MKIKKWVLYLAFVFLLLAVWVQSAHLRRSLRQGDDQNDEGFDEFKEDDYEDDYEDGDDGYIQPSNTQQPIEKHNNTPETYEQKQVDSTPTTSHAASPDSRVSHDEMSLHFATIAESGEFIHEVCSKSHAKTLADKFVQLTKDVPFWTACGESKWMEEMHKLRPTGQKIMFDIGCNKGYTSAKMFALWAPEIGFTPKTLHAKRPDVWCGNCGDCNEEIESEVQSSSGGVTVYCLEPSQANFAQLILTRDKFFGTQTTTTKNVHWLTVNAAASNQTAVSHFARGCTSEQCALNLKSPLYDLIDTTTVDAFILKHEIPYVDILKIDTEGYDATVIQGAMQSIASGKVGVITFEYHEVGVWKEYKLRDVVDWLNGLNYVCYFDGKPSLARMTGCWDDAYEIYSWSNVVCVKRSDPLYAAMEKMALRHEEYPGSYFKAMSE